MFGSDKIDMSLFYKYFLSNMIIFLIPFIAISSFFYYNSVNSLRNEIVQSNIHKLEQVRDMTDLQMEQLAKISMSISFDYRLTPYMVSHPPTAKQAIEELQRYRANNSLIDNLILYYQGRDEAYSPGGSGSLDTLLGRDYPVGGSYEGFQEFLKTVSGPLVLPASGEGGDGKGKKPFVTYVYPISTNNNSTAYGVVLFFIRETVLSDLIGNILGEFSGNVYIFNDKHEILASKDSGNSISLRDTSRLMQNDPGITSEQIDGRNYSVVTVYSKTSGRTFVAAIPTAQFYGKVADLQFFILNILVLIALIGSGSAIFLTVKQYKPIRSLYKDSEQLREKVNVQQPLVRDQCLLRLLKGDAKTGRDMTDLWKELHIPMTGSYFFVAAVALNKGWRPGPGSLQNREKAVQLLAHVSFPEGVGYGVELVHDHAVMVIVNLNPEAGRDVSRRQREFVRKLAHKLQEHGHAMPTIGVGAICDSPGRLNRSFIEATAATEYTLVNGQGCVIYFDEIAAQTSETFGYPDAEKMKFMQSLKQGDFDVSYEAFKHMIGSLFAKELSIEIVKCVCFDVINTVLKTVLDLGLHSLVGDIKALVEFRSVEELEKKIQNLMVSICDEVERRKENHAINMRDEIMGYIRRSYKNHALSLETTAEEFQWSVSYLSRFVKEQTGTTFTQLIWQLRVEEAKRQLSETERSIKEIVEDIGYVDVANFTSRFRKSEGVTPGQFRKQTAYSGKAESLESLQARLE